MSDYKRDTVVCDNPRVACEHINPVTPEDREGGYVNCIRCGHQISLNDDAPMKPPIFRDSRRANCWHDSEGRRLALWEKHDAVGELHRERVSATAASSTIPESIDRIQTRAHACE